MNSDTKVTSDHNDESRRRPGRGASNADESLAEFARRVERTYLARMKMAQRLQNRGSYWNGALISLAVSSSISSVALLVNPRLYGTQGPFALVVIGIFALVASLIVANADYAGRARHAFEAYRAIQRLSARAAAEASSHRWRQSKLRRIYAAIDDPYQDVLDKSDNHSAADYARAVHSRLRRASDKPGEKTPVGIQIVSRSTLYLRRAQVLGSTVVTCFPIALTVAACLSLVPVAAWIVQGL
jgi:SMODS and SLOG-associating 2TM effector domain family 5